MYTVEKKTSIFEQFVLKDTDANTVAVVTPSRGGMLTGLSKNGFEYIFINDNFTSNERPRCAMPVLFPCCGRTRDELYNINGKDYPMGIHGIVHQCQWVKISESTENGASVTIQLKANEITKKSYPFDFEIIYTYSLKGSVLTVYQEYTNNGEEVMPFSFGFHPYFCVSDVHNVKFDLNADNIIPAQTGKIEKFTGDVNFPFGTTDSVILTDARDYAAFTDTEGNRTVKVTFDKNFPYVVLWSGEQDKYLCVEPWNGLPYSLNTGENNKLQPKETIKAQMAIEI